MTLGISLAYSTAWVKRACRLPQGASLQMRPLPQLAEIGRASEWSLNYRSKQTSRQMKSSTVAIFSLAQALSKGPPPKGNLAVPIHSHGSMVAEFYTPVGHDPQKPHTRDEVYVVVRGRGQFFDGDKRVPVAVGSFIFVPAGQVHRFEDFSSDFAVWVLFYGPEGGEAAR